MKAKVTSDGVQIPKSLLEGITEVEIWKETGLILVRPLKDEPILQSGNRPVEDDGEGASENHDFYILAHRGLANAYGEGEPEYPLSLIKEPNPEYEGK